MHENLLIVQNKLTKIANILDNKGMYHIANSLDEINNDLYKQASMEKQAQLTEWLYAAISTMIDALVKTRSGATIEEIKRYVSDLIFSFYDGKDSKLTILLKNLGIPVSSFTKAMENLLGFPLRTDPSLKDEGVPGGPNVREKNNPRYMNRGGPSGLGHGSRLRKEFKEAVDEAVERATGRNT